MMPITITINRMICCTRPSTGSMLTRYSTRTMTRNVIKMLMSMDASICNLPREGGENFPGSRRPLPQRLPNRWVPSGREERLLATVPAVEQPPNKRTSWSVAAGLLHIKDLKYLLRRLRQIRRRLEGRVDNPTDMEHRRCLAFWRKKPAPLFRRRRGVGRVLRRASIAPVRLRCSGRDGREPP